MENHNSQQNAEGELNKFVTRILFEHTCSGKKFRYFISAERSLAEKISQQGSKERAFLKKMRVVGGHSLDKYGRDCKFKWPLQAPRIVRGVIQLLFARGLNQKKSTNLFVREDVISESLVLRCIRAFKAGRLHLDDDNEETVTDDALIHLRTIDFRNHILSITSCWWISFDFEQNGSHCEQQYYGKQEAPSLSSMWPYPLPVEKFPQFRNMFHDGTPTSSSNEIISQQQHHMQQQEQQMQQQQQLQQLQQQQIQQHLQQQQQMQLQQALHSQAQTQSQPSVVNSVPVMGTLQTVLTTGINPNMNNGTLSNLNQNLSNVLPVQASVAHTNTVHAGHTIVSNSSQIHSIPTTVNSNNVKTREPTQMITRSRLQDLVREVDPNEQLDEEVEDVLLQMADDFVESAITAACLLAKHRKSNTLEVKDLQLHLERHWNMWIPGFGTDELRPYKRSSTTDAHKQRLTLIRRAQKKY